MKAYGRACLPWGLAAVICCGIGTPALSADGVWPAPRRTCQSQTPESQAPNTGAPKSLWGHQTPDTSSPTSITLPKNALLPSTLTFQMWNGLMIVDAIVGKANIEHFVIDPGLDACTLTPNAAQLLTLASGAGEARITVYDKVVTAPRAQLDRIQFNALRVDNVPVGLVDVFAQLSPAVARRPDAPIGWLGAPLLSAFQVTFDYDKRYILLDRPGTKLPKEKGAITVPIELRDGCVLVKVSLPGARPFSALFSTSAPVTVIPTAAAQQARLKALEIVPFIQPGGKAGKVGRVLLPKVSIGKVSVEGMNAVFVAPDAPPEQNRNLAVLGPDFLKHYKITIDYVRRVMIFTPPPPAIAPATDEEKPQPPKKRGQGQGQDRN